MSDWVTTLLDLTRRGESAVLVSVVQVRGSTPREAGARMVVRANTCSGTIGGGNLEYRATDIARGLLAGRGDDTRVQRFALGPSFAQCCGGVAVVLFETITVQGSEWLARLAELRRGADPAVLATVIDNDHSVHKLVVGARCCFGSLDDVALQTIIEARARRLLHAAGGTPELTLHTDIAGAQTVVLETLGPPELRLLVFGAGHVGRALIAVLAGLPWQITWVDGRAEQFPGELPGNVIPVVSEVPCDEVARAAPGSYFLVMTHSHALDREIVEGVLRRGDARYCGLIGSRSKRVRFEKSLRTAGIAERNLGRLTCPIGVGGISGKRPGEIAVAVAAQVLQLRERELTCDMPEPRRHLRGV